MDSQQFYAGFNNSLQHWTVYERLDGTPQIIADYVSTEWVDAMIEWLNSSVAVVDL